MRLLLDHHYSVRIAVGLRERGHDVVTAAEHGWQSLADEPLLERCLAEGRALVTNNVVDVVVVARAWQAEGRVHAGLVFTSDRSMPRTRDAVGRYVDGLHALLSENPGDVPLAGTVRWL